MWFSPCGLRATEIRRRSPEGRFKGGLKGELSKDDSWQAMDESLPSLEAAEESHLLKGEDQVALLNGRHC